MTDDSLNAIREVLSQDGKPVTMISRTLAGAEESNATNKRELLPIVWALKTLGNYLYCIEDIKVFTDYQPFTLTVTDKNPNTKNRNRKLERRKEEERGSAM